MSEHDDFGDDNQQILTRFRQMAGSLASTFRARRDHVTQLLGPTQNYSSGIFREGLLRDFLREILPRAVEVSTGFIYGFEKVANSAQLDIVIWDASKHAAVYRTDSFVIVPPEAAIATISVKTGMTSGDVREAVSNLLTVAPLDLAYRAGLTTPLPPITKFVVCFDGNTKPDTLTQALGGYLCRLFAERQDLADAVVPALANLNPSDPEREYRWQVDRALPGLIVSLADENACGFIRGWGPPYGSTFNSKYGIKRLPYLYRLENRITSFFERFLYHVLSNVYQFLGTRGGSLIAAWGDFHPVYGFRIGDASEIQEHSGRPLLDPATVLQPRGQ